MLFEELTEPCDGLFDGAGMENNLRGNAHELFLVEEQGRPGSLISGDTLFLGSCGRVDLPGSDPEAMYRSLNQTLKQLPDETLLYPGHLYSSDPASTMGDQKATNPFLRVTSLDQFLMFMGA